MFKPTDQFPDLRTIAKPSGVAFARAYLKNGEFVPHLQRRIRASRGRDRPKTGQARRPIVVRYTLLGKDPAMRIKIDMQIDIDFILSLMMLLASF